MKSLLLRYKKLIITVIISFLLIRIIFLFDTREDRAIVYEYYFIIGYFLQVALITFKIFQFNSNKLQLFCKNNLWLKDIEWAFSVSVGVIIFQGFDEIRDNNFPKFNLLTSLLWIFIIYHLAVFFSNRKKIFQSPLLEKYKKFIFYPLAFAILALGSFISDNRGLFPSDAQFKTVFWLLLIYLIGNWFFNQWKLVKQLKNEKVNSELLLLKSQVNPHFFFNTLNNLYGLTVEKSDEAPQVVLKISDMMRYTIYEGKNDFVPLSDELAYLENYISLQKIRYHKKVDITFQQNIDEEDLNITPLLFIILLENAFKHGVENLTQNGFVNLSLTTENNMLFFVIENNFDPEEISPKKGIGLKNLKRRLELMYPEKHKLIFKNENNIFQVGLNIDLG